ncbi:MAG: radical SAM family heme chaperone HemW [Phycisphaerales bacterium]|nr:radical SAM family heme chaperone HemW [Phycisphaerales bacterium]
MSRLHVLDHTTPPPDHPQRPQTAEAALAAASGVGACIHGIYVHVPFCVHRCHYCDFFTIAGRDESRAAYVDRLLAEAEASIPRMPRGVQSVFIGGGTPTHLPAADLARLLVGLRRLLAAGGHDIREWTVEANPETVDPAVAEVLVAGGVTRVSLGAQSFDAASLRMLERRHPVTSVPAAMATLRAAGLTDLSLDLIFGVPGADDPLAVWAADLAAALALQPTHLSCYGLTYEPGTPLRRRLEQGRVESVSEELEGSMYRLTRARLAEAGYEHYEISNWARPGHRCLHNETYWLNRNWWPLGPSASGHVNGTRWRNIPRLGPWLEGEGLSHVDSVERLDRDGTAGEVLMLGLRRMDGVPRGVVAAACETPGRGATRRLALDAHVQGGLLAWDGDALRLTDEGMLLADTVLRDLL